MYPTLELLCRDKRIQWDFKKFISPEIHYDSVIISTKGLYPIPQVDMLFQPLIVLETIILARNYQMRCKGGNTSAVLSPYITPTYILTKRKNKSLIVKTRMVKTKNKITGNLKILK